VILVQPDPRGLKGPLARKDLREQQVQLALPVLLVQLDRKVLLAPRA